MINKIKYVECGNHVEGIMPNGSVFYIDKEDYEIISNNYWHFLDGYLRSTKLGLMHRYLLGDELVGKLECDHINRNRLDNRKTNLRAVTRQENMKNKSIYKSNTSGYRGVKWNARLNKWQVQITKNKQRTHLGVFEELQDAIAARRFAEK